MGEFTFCHELQSHYSTQWANSPLVKKWIKGPISELPNDFSILEFAPTNARRMWTYATCCMSQPSDAAPIELHFFSPIQSELHVELLTVIAHYHRTDQMIDLGHTVNFGRPWLDGSTCEFGLVSLPYLDGPKIENFKSQHAHNSVKCLWLIPITESERNYKRANGLEALERKFDESQLDYLNSWRSSVV